MEFSRIFPTQETNPGLPHCMQTLYRLHHQGTPWHIEGAQQMSSEQINLLQVCCLSVAKLCPTLCNIMDCSMPGLSVPSPSSRVCTSSMSIESVMPSNHLILCCPLLLLPSVFPSIRVFSNESVLYIRWSKYWSFSFNISPTNVLPGLISFRMEIM